MYSASQRLSVNTPKINTALVPLGTQKRTGLGASIQH